MSQALSFCKQSSCLFLFLSGAYGTGVASWQGRPSGDLWVRKKASDWPPDPRGAGIQRPNPSPCPPTPPRPILAVPTALLKAWQAQAVSGTCWQLGIVTVLWEQQPQLPFTGSQPPLALSGEQVFRSGAESQPLMAEAQPLSFSCRPLAGDIYSVG